DLVAKAHHQGKVVGLICHAGLVGISAGMVDGKRATGRLGIKDDPGSAGALRGWMSLPSAAATWCGVAWCPISQLSAANSWPRSRQASPADPGRRRRGGLREQAVSIGAQGGGRGRWGG